VPVETPDVPRLPWRWDGPVKVFELVAEPVQSRFVPWREPFNTWGYNGSTPGPTIEAVEGDRVRIVLENRLPEETAIHWHGLETPWELEGVPGLQQDPVAPGGRFEVEFTLEQNGTFFYHSHMPMQEMMGMVGFFIVHPRRPHLPRVDRDFAILLQEWAILPGNPTPNTLAMEFNWLTFNGKSGPAATPMLAQVGERIRLRFVNLGMDHHPMHLHGHQWVVTGTEGGRAPEATWRPGNTEIVGVAQARDLEFVARREGEWMLHCHLPHHMMNHMVSMVGPLSSPGLGVAGGGSMEEGMGMPHGGHALGESQGPSFGRTLGAGNEEQPTGHQAMGHHHGAGHAGPMQFNPVPPEARQVPGYPQDMFMAMDQEVEKPETFGLRPTWTAGMMGMMTLVRVLSPEKYQHIQELKRRQKESAEPAEHHHHHPTGGGR
nr:multicopper oxidase domain-containing protein [Thermoanaerobaculia bacterium]